MDYADIKELHYIAPLVNLKSVLEHGIFSHEKASKVEHESVAMQQIQELRQNVFVPNPSGGRRLHSYANLYFDARNPMLFVRRTQHNELCVVRVHRTVIELPGVVVTDKNASSGYARFGAGVVGLSIVDRELTFAEYWTSNDEIDQFRRRSARCAEVLVPDVVETALLFGAYVSTEANLMLIRNLPTPTGFECSINRHLFFQ